MNSKELSALIVDAVLKDLRGRQGIGDAIQNVAHNYEDVYNRELLPELRAVVRKVLDDAATTTSDAP